MEHPTDIFDRAEAVDLLQPAADSYRPMIAGRWQALEEAGRVVAALAGERDPPSSGEFASRVEGCDGEPRRTLEQAIDDLAAMMEPGLAALLYVCEHAGDPRPAAGALWREYSDARGALLALVSPVGD